MVNENTSPLLCGRTASSAREKRMRARPEYLQKAWAREAFMRPCSVWLASDSLWPARTTWLLATIGRWRSGPEDRLSSKVLSSVFTVVVPAFAFGQKMRRTGSSNTASFGTSCSNRTHDSAVIGCGKPVDMVEHSATRGRHCCHEVRESPARGALTRSYVLTWFLLLTTCHALLTAPEVRVGF